MQTMKETASNVAATAKAGMEKTKALVQEKAEKMSAHDPVEKEMAAEKKEERMARADVNKLEARQHNAAAKHAREAGMPAQYTTGPNYMTSGAHPHVTAPTGTHAQSVTGQAGYPTGTHAQSVTGQAGYPTGTHAQSVTGQAGYPTGTHQMPAVPEGHSTGGPGTNVGGYGPGYVAPSGPGTGGTY